MLTDIKIGQFFPANSLLHKLDARLKIVSLFILIVGIFVFDSQLDYIIWCVLIGSLMYMSKIPLKMFFISIKPIIWIILFTLKKSRYQLMGRSYMYNSSAITIGCFSFSYRSKIIITKYYNI